MEYLALLLFIDSLVVLVNAGVGWLVNSAELSGAGGSSKESEASSSRIDTDWLGSVWLGSD